MTEYNVKYLTIIIDDFSASSLSIDVYIELME